MSAKKRPNIHALPAAVYRLFDEHGALLYIGASYDPDARIACHRRKPWGSQIAAHKIAWYDSRPAAFRAEEAAIKDEDPLYNQPRRSRRNRPVVPAKPGIPGANIPDDIVAECMKRTGKTEPQVRRLLAKGLERLRGDQALKGSSRLDAA
jgi:predicted GIY-YIG superfamily endonuclease